MGGTKTKQINKKSDDARYEQFNSES